LIADARQLSELIERLSPLPQIAIDTEADSLHSYFEKLCLIQISTETEDVLVDPLAEVDLRPLYEVLGDKRLILHGADYDLRLFNRGGYFPATDIFDTMIAARLCGYQELGLAALVSRHFDVNLSKASQKANWALRPLSEQMLDYAISDTKYLLPLAAILEKELRRLERWEWFIESRDRLVTAAREPRKRDEAQAWRISGSAALSPREQSILRVLWQWRDGEASAWDRPAFHVMGNADLIRIAAEAAGGKVNPPQRMSGRRRKSFDVVLALALEIPESDWPVTVRVPRRRATREQMDRVEALKKIRDAAATTLALDPSILAPRSALEAAAFDPESPALMRWQRELLGLAALTGHGDGG
jgi:ribonuclease D